MTDFGEARSIYEAAMRKADEDQQALDELYAETKAAIEQERRQAREALTRALTAQRPARRTAPSLHPDHVPAHKTALRHAIRLGCKVEILKASGEVRVTAPDGTKVICNNRRDDASRALILMLRRIESVQPRESGPTPTNDAGPRTGYPGRRVR